MAFAGGLRSINHSVRIETDQIPRDKNRESRRIKICARLNFNRIDFCSCLINWPVKREVEVISTEHTNKYEDKKTEAKKKLMKYDIGAEIYEEGTEMYEEGTAIYEQGTAIYEEETEIYEEGTEIYEEGTKIYEERTKRYEK